MLFGLMAGVRNQNNQVNPIAEPRGLPEDVTSLTKFESDYWSGDGHSHSHLSLDEMIFVETEMKRLDIFNTGFGYIFGYNVDDYRKYPEDIPEGVNDVRIVFWFDN